MSFTGIGSPDDVTNLMGPFTGKDSIIKIGDTVIISQEGKAGEVVNAGATAEYKFKVNNPTDLKAKSVTWSDSTGNLPVKDRAPSIKVTGDPMLTFTDQLDDAVPLGIRNLRFALNLDEIPLSSLDFGAIPGLDSPRPDFVLQPSAGSSMSFDLGPLQYNKFDYAQGDVFDPSTGIVESSFIFGIQGVPEPPTFVLGSLGLLALLGYFGVVRSSERRVSLQTNV
jgi:hypothetical protein